MDRHEGLLEAFSPQGLGELDLSYGWLPLADGDAGVAHLFRAIEHKPGLQEHLFISYPNADGFTPGVTYAVQRVTKPPNQDTRREKIFQIHWDKSGNLNLLSFNDPVIIHVPQGAGNSVYSFTAEQGEFYEVPAVLREADIRQIGRLFQPSSEEV